MDIDIYTEMYGYRYIHVWIYILVCPPRHDLLESLQRAVEAKHPDQAHRDEAASAGGTQLCMRGEACGRLTQSGLVSAGVWPQRKKPIFSHSLPSLSCLPPLPPSLSLCDDSKHAESLEQRCFSDK